MKENIKNQLRSYFRYFADDALTLVEALARLDGVRCVHSFMDVVEEQAPTEKDGHDGAPLDGWKVETIPKDIRRWVKCLLRMYQLDFIVSKAMSLTINDLIQEQK